MPAMAAMPGAGHAVPLSGDHIDVPNSHWLVG